MNVILPILFATIAAVGNAMFALGQKRSVGIDNGLLFVGASALVAFSLASLAAPLLGPIAIGVLVRNNWRTVLMSGTGLFLTYVGFNLLYSRFGASHYVLYAVISIITTTVVIGFVLLKESVNGYHLGAIAAALLSIVLFSVGQARL
jgi:drug/metabolite transporter (DMT)-like permease